jgi:hypothetical protein
VKYKFPAASETAVGNGIVRITIRPAVGCPEPSVAVVKIAAAMLIAVGLTPI